MPTLAKLPAVEIIKLLNSGPPGDLKSSPSDPIVVKATDEFINSLHGQPPQMQKQRLGDKLFKVVKSFGVKGAPKVTIALLDQEDLRSLAHLMNSYPAVLKEKVLALTAAK
jgi:polyadenylate-binding protein